VVDTTPPAVAITAPADDSITNDNTPALTGTAEAGATVQISVDGAVVGTITANAGGAWTFTTAALADGPHAISVIATDAAGNASPPAVIDIIVDAAAPALALTTPAAGLQTNDVTLALTGTATDSGAGLATLLVEVLDAQGQVAFTAMVIPAADGSFAVDASALPEGVYTARATATDVAGNSVTVTNSPITIDTTAPAVALLAPADDAALSDDTPTVSGTAEVGATLEVVIRDNAGMIVFTAAPVVAADGTWSVDTSALADGAYTAQVTATDAASNAASTPSSSFLIDTTAPVVVIVSPADDALIASSQPTIQGTSEANSTLTLVITDAAGAVVATLTATADAQGAWSAAVAAALVDGAYTISATAVDVVGNSSAPVESSFTINSTALPLNITAPMPGAVLSAAPQIVGTTAPGAVVTVEIVGANGAVAETLTATADNAGAWSVTPAAALADGTYTAEATVRNPAGVESDATTSFTVDTTAPALAIATPAEGAQINNPQPSISGTAEAGATLEVVITDAAGAVVETLTATADAQGMWSVTPATLADGAYTVNVEASDAAGNTATAGPRAFTVDSNAPTVTITSPVADQEVADTTPTVTGTAEPGAVVTIVIDGQVVGTATAGADGMWSFEVPALTPGTHTVEARTTDGAGNMGSSGSVSFEVKTQAPVVIVTPVMGGAVTGPTVVVTGTGEPGATITVTVGGQTKTAVVGQDGAWTVSFDAVPAGMTTIEAGDGSTSTSVTVTVNDPTVVPGDEDGLVLAGGCAQGAGGGPASGALWMLVLGALTLRRRARRIVGGHLA
jgi:hypothetical protein